MKSGPLKCICHLEFTSTLYVGRDLSRFSAAETMHCMQYATDIDLHVHSYAVDVSDIAACEGLPHNVLHSSSIAGTSAVLVTEGRRPEGVVI